MNTSMQRSEVSSPPGQRRRRLSSTWEAANRPTRRDRQSGATVTHTTTLEASLHRCARTYQDALDCSGALYQADKQQTQSQSRSNNNDDNPTDILRRVGRVARQTWEALLQDPLIRAALQHEESSNSLYAALSEAQQRTIQQIAYLALVNYADLLGAAGGVYDHNKNEEDGVQSVPNIKQDKEHVPSLLDRGLGPRLTALSGSCWQDEESNNNASNHSPQQQQQQQQQQLGAPKDETPTHPDKDTAVTIATLQRMVRAYIDATAIDSSDPLVWLKLASAARRLGRAQNVDYRLLERHALSHGVACRPQRPHRQVLQAWKEWEAREGQRITTRVYMDTLKLPTAPTPLPLLRYSWAVLGRLVWRAAREAPPLVHLHLAPLLAVPDAVWDEYLGPALDAASVRRLACVCRTLSVRRWTPRSTVGAVSGATAAMAAMVTAQNPAVTAKQTAASKTASVADAAVTSTAASASTEAPANSTTANNSNQNNKPFQSTSSRFSKEVAAGSRVSKRLRSQIITSGKRAERSQRRASVEYCVYAITTGNSSPPTLEVPEEARLTRVIRPSAHSGSKPTSLPQRNDAWERVSQGSLLTFCQRYTAPTTPLTILFGYLAHVSVYADQIFSGDHHGTLVLLAAVTDCIDLVWKRTVATHQGLVPAWSAGELFVPAGLSADQLWAMDLLQAELRFKRCDREDQQAQQHSLLLDFDSDAHIVERLVPVTLGNLYKSTVRTVIPEPQWNALWVRYHWLLAGYYLWRGRLSHDVAESRQAEQEGLACVKETIRLMQKLNVSGISTPHLEGIGRSGNIWKELSVASLTAFQNKVQASSVVLKAQEQFIDAVANVAQGEEDLTQDERKRFVTIATYLLERYSSTVDSHESNYLELLEDFMGVHGTAIFSYSLDQGAEELRTWFLALIPIDSVDRDRLCHMDEQCILSILISCMHLGGKQIEIARLLLNLIQTLQRYQEKFLDSIEDDLGGFGDGTHADSISEDLSLMSNDDEGPDAGNRSTVSGYARLLGLLIEAIEQMIVSSDGFTRDSIFTSSDFPKALEDAYKFCANMQTNQSRSNNAKAVETSATQFVLERMESLHDSIEDVSKEPSNEQKVIRLSGLVSVFLRQEAALRSLLKVSNFQKTQSSWISQMNMLAKEVGYVCLSLGSLLSKNLTTIDEGKILPSKVVRDSLIPVQRIISALLFIFRSCEQSIKGVLLKEILRVPVSTGLIGFCGATATTDFREGSPLSLLDFVDSDESATEWLAEDDDEEQNNDEQGLRVITQLVHLVHLIIDGIEEDSMSLSPSFHKYITNHGPLFPLVAYRVLGFCADTLLDDFRGEESDPGLQSRLFADYSVGTRKVGMLLDSSLHKICRCLYGFNLHSAGDAKEKESSSHPTNNSTLTTFLPESVSATAQLYRYVMRVTAFGRKMPPKSAIDTIQAALPDFEESRLAQQIRTVLFDARKDNLNLSGLLSAALKQESFDAYFADVSEFVASAPNKTPLDENDESSLVRHGIAHVIAQGPLPQYQEAPDRDARTETASVESELNRKFHAILFELGHENVENCKNWVKAAQCCWTKAEMIADRIGKQFEFVKCSDFIVSGPICTLPGGLSISDLLEEQEKKEKLRVAGWTESIGRDLSVYMEYCWSSFDSLKDFSRALEGQFRSFQGNREDIIDSIHAYEEITRLFRDQHFGMWQQSWGALFVSSLRVLARRCMSVALYVGYRRLDKTIESGDERLSAEICESLGTFMYTEISGSQIYGHPMRTMTEVWKRDHAEAALKFYTQALALQNRSTGKDGKTNMTDWDLLFIIGKCHEKIASTFSNERFPPAPGPTETAYRRYEYSMRHALQAYADSFEHGLKLEKEGVLGAEQQGGSSHGATEVQYRLHATRLKCLINALKHNEQERDAAEAECLRLVEKHFWSKSPPDPTGTVRDRAWNVLTDLVDALIQCRVDYSCYHRSVFRHAQALLWAPLVNDPTQSEGSFGEVPGSRANKLRGLNSGGALESAASVIGSLFDRRRAQLCAVWMTQGSAEAFEQINVTVRKYDSLRGKYIAAYLDILQAGHRKNEIETFWRWVSASSRDLPSYMQMTAGNSNQLGAEKGKSHTNDYLLLTARPFAFHHMLADVKRRTNAALAAVILHEVQNLKATSKVTEGHLKQIYSCYLRLNCEAADLHKSRIRKLSSVKPIVDGLVYIYTQLATEEELRKRPKHIMGDWSMDSQQTRTLDLALEKCRELFPTLNNNFLSSKKTNVSKKRRGASSEPEAPTQQVFRVNVPEGMSEGETFLTDIMVGETKKRIRLTVPQGGATTLRFTLSVPKESEGPPNKQQKATEEMET